MDDKVLDILIVGSGPAGMLSGIIATEMGLSFAIVEARDGLHREPSAHVLKTHTMEVYRRAGAAAAIFKETTPTELQQCATWCESLTGVCYGRLDLRGKKGDVPRFTSISPVYPANVPQNVVEPILYEQLKCVAGRNPVQFGQRLLDFRQDSDGIVATISDGGANREVRARYLLGADGAGSQVRRSAGIAMEGPPSLATFLAIHINSDARPLLQRYPGVVFFIRQPDISGFFIMHQPVGSQVFMLQIDPAATPVESFDEAICRDVMDRVIGQPHDYRITSIGSWVMSAQVAERYREGRAFLIGDAGHRFPPTGGLGLNTGVEDVENLLWKINAVLRGQAADSLLDSYQMECRPIAVRNTQQSLKNNARMQIVETALDMGKEGTSLESVLEDLRTEAGHPRYAKLQDAVDEQVDHFAYLELDMAARVSGGAFIPPAREIPLPVPEVEGFLPSFSPGNYIPHFWVEPGRAAIDCLRFDMFTLFVPAPDAAEWQAAASAVGDEFLPIRVVPLTADMSAGGTSVGDFWGDEPFAVLVRPDGRIGWVEPVGLGNRSTALRESMAAICTGTPVSLEQVLAA